MARGRPYRFANFGAGWNTYDNVFNLKDGSDGPAEARDLLNVVSRSRGNVGKRDGSTTVKARSGIKDLSIVDDSPSALAIYSTDAGALFALDGSGTETSIASGLSTSAPWTFLRLPTIGGTQGPYLGMNGTDTPRYITSGLATGAWTAASGALPNGTMMVYAGNRLWVSDGVKVYWSEIGDPRTWPADNVLEFNPSDGLDITGLAAVGSYVLVFKRNAMWRIYDLDTGANVRVADEVGTQSPRAIVSTDQGCFFIDPQRGLMVTDAQMVRPIGHQILPTIQRIIEGDLDEVVGAYWNGHIYFGCRLDGLTRCTLDFQLDLGAWWFHSLQSRALGTWNRGTGLDLVGANPTTLARLFVDGVTTDEGVVFRSYWSGPYHSFGASLRSRCHEVRLDGSGTADIFVLADFYAGQGTDEDTLELTDDAELFGGAGAFGGTGAFGGGLLIGQDSIYSCGVGRVWSITVGNETDDPWEMDAYSLFVSTRKD